MSEPAASRLRAIARDLRRLAYCSRNPSAYHELKSELVWRLEVIAKELAAPPPAPPRSRPPKKPVQTGTIAARGRAITVTTRARRK
jgi:hypothetical protein